MSKKAKARLCDPSSWLSLVVGASSRNIAFASFDMSVNVMDQVKLYAVWPILLLEGKKLPTFVDI